jgi:hypothetical protein
VQLHVLIEVRQPDLDHLWIKTFGVDRRRRSSEVAKLA